MGLLGWLRAIVYALTHPREFLAALRGRLVPGYRVPATAKSAPPRADAGTAEGETGGPPPRAHETEAGAAACAPVPEPVASVTDSAADVPADAPDLGPLAVESSCAANGGTHEDGAPRASAIRRPAVPREGGDTAVPESAPVDDVQFSITAPAALAPDSDSELRFWAHLDEQRVEVLERAMRESGVSREDELAFKSEGPFPIARGSVLSVRIEVKGLTIEPDHKLLTWTGSIGCATFLVSVPAGAKRGAHAGSASIRLNGSEIGAMRFVLKVGEESAAVAPLPAEAKMHRTAFASYASEDRDQVIARVQGMEAAYKGLKVFVDVASLRAGEDWEAELQRHVAGADVFYLFWCRHAKESEWVGKEWHWALESRGTEFIDPVPLEDPALAAPPAELAAKHFNDPWLAYVAVKAHSCGA